LTGAFEQLLGLPARTLSDVEDGSSNRSLTIPEAEVVRRANKTLFRLAGTRWSHYIDAFRTSALNRALIYRSPRPGEARLRLPAWANDRAAQDGRRYARRIAASGVRVIGDLAALATTPEAADDDGDRKSTRLNSSHVSI